MEIKSLTTIYQEDKKRFWLKLAGMVAAALAVAFALSIYFAILEERVTLSGLLHVNPLSLIRVHQWLLVFAVILVTMFAALFYRREACHYLFKYRFLIAGIAFILCVILEINGSSFGNWGAAITGVPAQPLIGISREIRSDEWMVFTPMAISQYVNPMGSFGYFNSLLRAAPTDYFMVYGQPVRDIAMIFRPFQIGYLFLSEGQGMAFYWCGRIIALFLVSFEFGRLLTKDRRVLSVVYAALLTFSPVVQWWFSVNGLVEMLVAGQLMIVITDRYIEDHEALWKKALYSLAFFICAGTYAFTLYLSWEIPLAFIFFALFVWVIATKRKSIRISLVDGLFLGLGALMLVAVSAHIFIQSWDAIQTVLHTAYPGERLENGGFGFFSLFDYPLTIYYPIKELELNQVVCEEAFFYDFFPLGILLTIYLLLKDEKKDGLSIIFVLFFAVFAWRIIMPWPAWLSKITLLSKVLSNRLVMVVSWLNLLLLIRGLALIPDESGSQKRSWPFAAASVAFSIAIVVMSALIQKNYVNPIIAALSFGLLFLGTLGIALSRRPYGKGLLLAGIFIICFFSGMTVNPVNRGLDTVKTQTLYQTIKQNNKKEDIWIVEGMKDYAIPRNNYPMMAGAATINTTNTYPNMDRWRTLTSDPSQEDMFNRYAHIVLEVAPNVDFEPELLQPDLILVKLNPSYLKQLNVTKILSGRNLTAMSTDAVSFQSVAEDSGYTIFEVRYQQ
ncbi:MAG: hypothetical protein IJG85_06105 [Eubacteriaceae bacterium]|nr:hypothetical protein [Eubacteriaceae bacterium]